MVDKAGNNLKCVVEFRVYEAIRYRLVKAQVNELLPEQLFAGFVRLIFTCTKSGRKGVFDLVVTDMTSDLFDEVFFDRDIVPPGRRNVNRVSALL